MSAARDDSGGWLRERLGWAPLTAALAAYRIPRGNIAFYLGGTTLFLLLVQVASGIMLTLYYKPDAAQAFRSVERITGEIEYGNLVHSFHVWSSDLFIACLFAHLFFVLVRRGFRAPHELSWLTGLMGLVLGVGLAFTGDILPWSQRAYTDARVGSEFAKYVPLVGTWLNRFLRGGDEVTSNTLVHAYGFHVAALPAALTLVVALHIFLLTRRSTPVPEEASRETIPLYPDFFVRQAAALTAVLVVIMTLAIFFERPLGIAADPRLSSPGGAMPPWYFLAIHQILRAAPTELLGIDGARFLVSAACLLGLLVAALPFIDRRGSKATAVLAWVLLFVLILLAASALN